MSSTSIIMLLLKHLEPSTFELFLVTFNDYTHFRISSQQYRDMCARIIPSSFVHLTNVLVHSLVFEVMNNTDSPPSSPISSSSSSTSSPPSPTFSHFDVATPAPAAVVIPVVAPLSHTSDPSPSRKRSRKAAAPGEYVFVYSNWAPRVTRPRKST
eukprot:TRINITY_DN8813_c0_g1_i1.p1 TRINITY_DN8813_c0_g1~~TRINITY_DN8813_c0_g1_i1.p1  ORF type:complete len:179 (-),score=46.31 TRINITY_DN8813_c0_g1_i1:175-639(-)